MILDHNISTGTESLNNEQVCVVKLSILQLLRPSIIDILNTDEGKLQVDYDVKHHLPSLYSTFLFPFDELRHSPWKCTTWFGEQMSKIQPLIDSRTKKNVVDKIVGHAAHLAYLRHREGNMNSGYIFEATLELVHYQISCVETGIYVAGGNEEVTACSVCLENLKVGMEFSKLPCSHMFHVGCVGTWLEKNKTCPNCIRELVYKDATEE